MFELKSQLFEENQEGQGAGSNDKAADPVAAAPVTLEALKSLFGDFQTSLLKNVDSKINSINKEVKTQNAKLATDWSAFKDHVSSSLHPPQSEEQEAEHETQEVDAEPESKSAKKTKDGQGEPREETRERESKPARAPQPYRASPKEQSLERQITEMRAREIQREAEFKKTKEEAERKEIDGLLRTEIAKHSFNSKKGPDDFFELVRNKIERDTEGQIYGPQGSKLEEYITNEYEERPFMHPPKPINGSGAGNATGANGAGGFDINKIGPGMSAAEEKAAWAAIQAAYKSA
jgi:hypothetical protein